MSAIHIEEAAAVGAELLDRNLRRRRSHRQGLRGDHFLVRVLRGLDQVDILVGLEVLHDSLRNQQNGQDHGKRQQDVHGRTHEIDPEIADRLC